MPADQALEQAAAVWRDPARPVGERVRALLGVMTLTEKIAQLGSVWVAVEGAAQVAPHQHELHDDPRDLAELLAAGIGQLTRVYGTRPVPPRTCAQALAGTQRR